MIGILFALIAASGWGASAVFTKIALEKIDTRLGKLNQVKRVEHKSMKFEFNFKRTSQ